MFLWKATKKALPVGTALSSRGIVADSRCKRCGEIEDAVHIFLSCSYAAQVWDQAPLLYKPRAADVGSMEKLLEKGRSILTLPPVGLGAAPLYPWILWFLWKARNLLIFEERLISPAETIQKAITEAKRWQSAKLQQVSQKPAPQPRLGTDATASVHSEALLCFSDAAWQASSRLGGMGWIIKDPLNSVFLQGSSSRPFVTSALVAEALALKAGIQAALASGVSRLACFSDCKELVLLLNSDGHANELDGILTDITLLGSSFLSISFHFVPRLENAQADLLAKTALLSCNTSSLSGV